MEVLHRRMRVGRYLTNNNSRFTTDADAIASEYLTIALMAERIVPIPIACEDMKASTANVYAGVLAGLFIDIESNSATTIANNDITVFHITP